MSSFEPVIGLEVHAQLHTQTKLFCGCQVSFGEPPNTRVCPTCAALPGALPVLNAEAVRLATIASLALGCEVRGRSVFARKNYFYPDLPKGYQISQFDLPIAEGGVLEVPAEGDEAAFAVRITRLHMEEDAGKNVHGAGGGLVDLNRAGTPLAEIVSEPDLRSARQAARYLRALRDVLLYCGVCDGNLEEGSFRCDANVSIRPSGSNTLGTRVELKNINSFRFVEQAINHEIARQMAEPGKIVQETRGWDADKGATYSLRSKEDAHDYRYFPDPDLPEVLVSLPDIEAAKARLPELPAHKRARYVAELGLSAQAAVVLTQHPRVAGFFEQVALGCKDPVKVANFVLAEVLRDTSTHGFDARLPLQPPQLVGLLRLVEEGALSGKQAKEVYGLLQGTSKSADELVKELGMSQLDDAQAIFTVCQDVVNKNPKQAESYRAGKTQLFGFFVGQVMKATQGRANPQRVNEALATLLGTGAP
jgi:aspartyl-tRNA(Asn)/glutamyl-tRNA(Gln) amidotransferase subunit B